MMKPNKPITNVSDPEWIGKLKQTVSWLMDEVQRIGMSGDGTTFSVTQNAGGSVGHASPAIELGTAELGGITVTTDADANLIAEDVTIDDMLGNEIATDLTVRLFGKGLSTSVTFDASTDVLALFDGTRWVASLAISDIATGYDVLKDQVPGHDLGEFVWDDLEECDS